MVGGKVPISGPGLSHRSLGWAPGFQHQHRTNPRGKPDQRGLAGSQAHQFRVRLPTDMHDSLGTAPRGLPRTRRPAGTTAPTVSRQSLWKKAAVGYTLALCCAAPNSLMASCQPSGIWYVGLKKKQKTNRALSEKPKTQMLDFATFHPGCNNTT